MSTANVLVDVSALIDNYLQGLCQASSAILSEVFHPDARYINTVSGEYLNLSVSDYFKIVDQRTAPCELKQPRRERIISIENDGENMAFVKLSMQMYERQYLDYLTLIRSENRWQIISKVFSFKPLKGE